MVAVKKKPSSASGKGASKTSTTSSTATKSSMASTKKTSTGILEAELKRFGGTSDDLQLLKDIDNDSDDEFVEKSSLAGSGEVEKKDSLLINDLKSFMSNLGLPNEIMQVEEENKSEDVVPVLEKVEKKQKKKSQDKVNAEKQKVVEEKAKDEKAKKDEKTQEEKEKKEAKLEAKKKQKENEDRLKSISAKQQQQQQSTKSDKLDTADRSTKSKKSSTNLLIPPTSSWTSLGLDSQIPPKDAEAIRNTTLIRNLKAKAEALYNDEVANYEKYQQSTTSHADLEFIQTVLRSGTTTDRISTLTLLITSSPIHTLHHLQSLMNNMARKKGRREAVTAVDAIKDLLVNTLLPSDRKLVYFEDRNLTHSDINDQVLLVWYFEDLLKRTYYEFVQLLEQLSLDNLPFVRTRILTYVATLLTDKPEQERNLLTLLVNKLGDLDRKIASKASYLLSQLLLSHPSMKLVVAQQVKEFALKTGTKERAVYYALVFLNQIILTKKETPVANYLIDFYMTLFTTLSSSAKQVEQLNPKLLTAILTGINRAYPFSQLEQDKLDTHLNQLFKMVHLGSSFAITVQSLMLIFQIVQSRDVVTDRYYSALYSTLLDSRLPTFSKPSLYLNLLYRSLKHDTVEPRIKAFIKRLLQSCLIRMGSSTPLVVATLYMISEVTKLWPGIWVMIRDAEDNEDDVEKFVDILDEEDEAANLAAAALATAETEAQEQESDETSPSESTPKPLPTQSVEYDGKKRDPRFANAHLTCLWELTQLSNHFHPTIQLYAQTLLQCQHISFPESKNYDPIQNHTLIRFLDRFVYKNPKKIESSWKGTSIMQSSNMPSSSNTSDLLVRGGKKKMVMVKETGELLDDLPVNSKEYLNSVAGSSVPADETFFVNYFKKRDELESNLKKKKKRGGEDEDEFDANDDDDEDVEEELEEEDVWKAIKGSSGFPEGAEPDVDDEEDDEELEALDAAMNEDDDEIQVDEDFDVEGEMGEMMDMSAWAKGSGNADDDEEEEEVDEEEEDEEEDGEALDLDEDFEDVDGEEDSDEEYDEDALMEYALADDDDEQRQDLVPKNTAKDSKRKLSRLAVKAAKLGYKGSFFKKPGAQEKDEFGFEDFDSDANLGDGEFASADDFLDLIEKGDMMDSEAGVSKKRKAGGLKAKKGKKIRK